MWDFQLVVREQQQEIQSSRKTISKRFVGSDIQRRYAKALCIASARLEYECMSNTPVDTATLQLFYFLSCPKESSFVYPAELLKEIGRKVQLKSKVNLINDQVLPSLQKIFNVLCFRMKIPEQLWDGCCNELNSCVSWTDIATLHHWALKQRSARVVVNFFKKMILHRQQLFHTEVGHCRSSSLRSSNGSLKCANSRGPNNHWAERMNTYQVYNWLTNTLGLPERACAIFLAQKISGKQLLYIASEKENPFTFAMLVPSKNMRSHIRSALVHN